MPALALTERFEILGQGHPVAGGPRHPRGRAGAHQSREPGQVQLPVRALEVLAALGVERLETPKPPSNMARAKPGPR